MSLVTTIASAFRHSGRDALKRNEIVYFLTFDRKWMSVEQANILLKLAADRGLISQNEGMIKPVFDIQEVAIPLGFKPDSGIFDIDDPFERLVDRIASATGRSPSEIVSSANSTIHDAFDGNLLPSAALVIIATEEGVSCEDLLPDLRASVTRKT